MLSRYASRQFRPMLPRRGLHVQVPPIRPRWKHSGGLLAPMMKHDSSSSSSLLPPLQESPPPLLPKGTNSEELSEQFYKKERRRIRQREKRRLKQLEKDRKELPVGSLGSLGVSPDEAHTTPLYLVHKWYERYHYGKFPKIVDSKYEEQIELAVKMWRTCNLQCPITGITMESGTLRDCDKSEIKVVEGKQYYEIGKWARQAAAARLWDSIRYTETNEMEPRLCEEEPILLPKELFLAEPGPGTTSPINALHNMHQRLGNTNAFKQGLKVIETLHGFTATFSCPLTGHAVESGSLKPESLASDFEYKVVDGKVFYASQRLAEHAVAARFLDDLKNSQTEQTEPRLCEEIPSLIDSLEDNWLAGESSGARIDSTSVPEKSSASGENKRSGSNTPKYFLSLIYDEFQSSNRNASMGNKGMSVTKTNDGWTATYQCPLTNHMVESGRWREGAKFHETDGAICYEDQNDAEYAAAARFLDDLTFSKTGEVEPRLCDEIPVAFENFETLWKEQRIQKQDSLSLERGLKRMHKLYGGKHVIEDAIFTMDTDNGYTSTFTCPFSGHVVESGRFRDGYKIVDGVVYYNEKDDAKKSVLARLADDLTYTRVGKLDPRLCEEEPAVIENFGLLLYPGKGPAGIVNDVYRSKSYHERQSAVSLRSRAGKEWTATFTCPVTGHVEQAGTLKRSGDAHKYAGTAYYNNETGAKVAVFARFLDNLWYTQTGKVEPRWCEEIPSVITADGIAKLFFDAGREKGYAIAVERENATRILWSVDMLNMLYRKSQIDFNESAFETSSLGASYWTSSLTCPLTGLVIKASTLRTSMDAEVFNGEVFYSNKRGAMMAAAARYLDDLRFTQTGETEPRWCEESPSLVQANGIESLFMDTESEKEYVDNLLAVLEKERCKRSRLEERKVVGVKELLSHSLTSGVTEAKSLERPISEKKNGPQQEIISQSQYEAVEDDEEEELVIKDISSFASSGMSALDRIMDTWGEPVATRENLTEASNQASINRIVQVNPAQQKEKVIADTVAWHERLTKQGANTDQLYRVFQTSPMTIKSATVALRALAKAHWNYPSEDLKTNQRVEAAAKQMIDLMWASDSPTIEGYNLYLHCLARPGATADGQAVDDILRAMVDRTEINGRLLPEPDIRTFNTVIQQCALSGGDDAYSKCKEIFDLIEEAEELGFDVQPNRDTFLSVLSSLAHPSAANGVPAFDRDKARLWIKRIEQMGEDRDDSSLVADTQVYNAPLRWSGGTEALRTRPFAQGLPWDRYSDIFKNGVRPLQEDDPLWAEARKITEWMYEMEAAGLDPDAETIEAAIQAWTRTGTIAGLNNATDLAGRALNIDEISSRFQTFHPILSAWAFSGEGLKIVESWINCLDDLSGTTPELKPDERTYLVKMIAKRTTQKRMLSVLGIHAINSATEIAESCNRDLDELIELVERDGSVPLDPSAFSHALRAWGDVALAEVDSTSANSEAIDAMINIVKKYDKTLQHWLAQRSKGDIDLKTTLGGMDSQLRPLLQYSQTVYLNALSVFNELDQKRSLLDTVEESSAFYKYFFVAEAMLRRAQELRLVLYASLNEPESLATSPDDISIQYNDLYTYSASVSDAHYDNSYLEKQIALYSAMVDGCKVVQKSDCFGDSVKVAMLIVGFVEQSSSGRLSSREEVVDCTNLYCGILDVVEAIPNESDRHEALRRVFNSVNSLSDKENNDGSPFMINKDVIMAVLKTDASAVEISKTSVRPRRLKRQRWRTASRS